MFLRSIGSRISVVGGGDVGVAGGGIVKQVVRHFSRKRAPNLRRINPKVPPQEASSIAQNLYQIVKQNGPLSVSNTWNQIKEGGGISGLNSKTHMKIMLHWMRGRKLLKLLVNHVGSSKKFLVSVPEDPTLPRGVKLETEKIEKPKVRTKPHQNPKKNKKSKCFLL